MAIDSRYILRVLKQIYNLFQSGTWRVYLNIPFAKSFDVTKE